MTADGAVVADTGARLCAACGEPAEPEDRFCENCGAPLTAAGSAAPATGAAPLDVPGGTEAGAAVTGDARVSPPTLPAAPVAAGTAAPAEAAPAEASTAELGSDGVVSTAAPPSGACPSCGGTDGFDADGFCLACGLRPVRPRDHLELDLGRLAVVSDKGPRKVRNEDSFAAAVVGEDGFAVSVCDGVSNIPRSDEASQAAADAAIAVLRAARPEVASGESLQAAAERASEQVVGLAPMAVGGEPPSCTFLAATYQPGRGLSVGWLGDCRAYALSSAGVQRLTTDHSWGTEAVASGLLTQAEADRDERSHAITRWLGADAGRPPVAEVVHWQVPDPDEHAVLVFCSDGAWNYFDLETLGDLVGDGVSAVHHIEPLSVARRITAHAIDGGGHDNITVAVALLAPDGAAPAPAHQPAADERPTAPTAPTATTAPTPPSSNDTEPA